MRGRIVSFSVIPRSRKQLLTIEVDGEVPPALTDSLKVLPNVISVELIEAV